MKVSSKQTLGRSCLFTQEEVERELKDGDLQERSLVALLVHSSPVSCLLLSTRELELAAGFGTLGWHLDKVEIP